MDDMNAFDRQLASVVLRRVGPPEPVDDAAIFTAFTATRSAKRRFQTMFSATKFVVAGVIVALFGGFLLAGILTQSSEVAAPAANTASASPSVEATTEPDATLRTDLLPGVALVAEEVEPGVSRIVSDGVRDLSWDPGQEDPDGGTKTTYRYYHSGIAVGSDGIVWFFRPDGYFLLGAEPTYAWREGEPKPRGAVEVSPFNDGSLPGGKVWNTAFGLLWYVWPLDPRDGMTAWASAGNGDVVAVNASGAIWVASQNLGGQFTLSSSDGPGRDGDWTSLPYPGPDISDLWVTDADVVWTLEYVNDNGGHSLFRRFDGTTWEVVDVPSGPEVFGADVGSDGTAWAWLKAGRDNGPDPDRPATLARHDASGWQTFGTPDEVPPPGKPHDGHDFLKAAPDGSVWYNTRVNGKDEPVGGDETCDGLAHFDGSIVTRYLRGLCIYNLDVAPDGTAWALAGADFWTDPGLVETYVIDPEAMTASE